jgi:DNA-directed RNA polymerase specialized sigma24 family protein
MQSAIFGSNSEPTGRFAVTVGEFSGREATMDRQSQFVNSKTTDHKREQRFLHFKLMPDDETLLDQLTDNQRALILSEGSYKERANQFGLPVGTVRSRLHRARLALAELRQERDTAHERAAQLH